MSETRLRIRPLLAVALGAVVTGLGHLYLRRWRRALGWLLVTVGTANLVVPESALDALASGGQFPFLASLPLLAISTLSVVDAYVVAVNAEFRAGETTDTESDSERDCPNCGRSTDRELDFCQWCSTPVEARSDGTETRN